MFRFKRGILLFLVLILLPFSSAQAMQPNEPNEPNELYWRGTVIVKWVHRARWSFPSSLGILRGMIEEYYTRTIYADGYGNATQKIEVSYFQYQQVDCIDHVGFYRRKAKDTYSTGPYLFNMVITDLQASPEYSQPGLSVIFKHELQCGQGTTESVEILDYDAAFLSPDDGEFSPILNVVHGADRYGNYVPSYAGNTGEEIVIFVTLYDLVLFDSANHFFSGTDKQALRTAATYMGWTGTANDVAIEVVEKKFAERLVLRRALGVLGMSIELAGKIDAELAKDPPDPNFTEIALPVTPTTSLQPIAANGDLSPLQADAFNALLTNLQQGIGLGRAMLTCFNRASGAQQANDSYWVGKQLQASRTYAGQFADLLAGRPQLMENLRMALQTDPNLPLDITAQDLSQYQYDLVVNGLSIEAEQLLTEMGVDARGKADIFHAMILAEFPQDTLTQGDVIVQFPGILNDPELIQTTQVLAGLLMEYSMGRGWKLYIPATMH